jgi:hypothetical protein
VLLAPIGNPEPKGLHPSGHLHFSSHGGTKTVKMQFATGAKKIQKEACIIGEQSFFRCGNNRKV